MVPEDDKARSKNVARATSERDKESANQPETTAAGNEPKGASDAGAGPARIGARPPQYMISPRPAPSGLQTLSADFVAEQLQNSPDITVVKTIAPPRLFGMQSTGDTSLGSLVIARMNRDKAELLQAQAGAQLTVERDPPLTFCLEPGPGRALPNPGVLTPHSEGFTVTIEVVGEKGPLAGADVFIFGSVWPTQGKTGLDGRATITVTGESPDTINALYVKPKLDHWGLWQERPQLVPNTVNVATVKPLASHLRDFPGRQLMGWGEQAMGLHRVPPSFDGTGIKVAVVDSGAAKTHRNLLQVGPGASIVGADRNAWADDTIGHGSHCAGIIAGGPLANGTGIRGFAPAAEVHVLRIFPGGRFSDLVGALDYCMENGIDVVNLSLGGGEPSRIIEERLQKAKEMGIACIAAAGNSAGPVQYPASSTHCLAVAAIGKSGEFPADSFHAQQVLDDFQSRDGYFPAKFSCFGPEVDVAAPGVAIVSSVPDDSFGAWDGTSMAAPHVTGLAALVLAHHPDFKGAFQSRDARRVERLFQILKGSTIPLQFGDPQRSGTGMPYAPLALGIETGTSAPVAAGTPPVSDASFDALRRLLALIAGGARPGASVAPQSADVAPQSMLIGGKSTAVVRGPARTGPTLAPVSQLFAGSSAKSTVPTFDEFREAMRNAGILPR